MKIFHEAPISIFEDVQKITDGDYALVHLLDSNPAYAEKFMHARFKGREIILDNSAFELGESFDPKKFVEWIDILEPDYYVIPDKLRDAVATVNMLTDFVKTYNIDPKYKSIGVVQGRTYEECVWCYTQMVDVVDKIAFNISYAPNHVSDVERYQIRPRYLTLMLEDGIIRKDKPHHLLGVILPQEMKYYRDRPDNFFWIDSVDTSNPVIAGMHLIRYYSQGMDYKIQNGIGEYMDYEVSIEQKNIIEQNIAEFRRMCGGDLYDVGNAR